MKVTATIQSKSTNPQGVRINEPVGITYYTGDDLPQAMSAVVQAMADKDRDASWTETLDITVKF